MVGMYKDRVPSDSELLLGSVFVVCVLIGVGVLGDAQQGQQMVITPVSMTAAGSAAPATGASGFNANTSQSPRKEAKNLADCKERVPNTSGYATVEYACNDNCVYYVKGSEVQPVYQPNTKPGIVQMYVFSLFGGSYKVGKCTERGLAGSLGNMDNSYRSLYYQNSDAFKEVSNLSPTTGGTAGSQSANQSSGALSQTTRGLSSYSPYGPNPANPGSTPWGYDSWQQSTAGSYGQPTINGQPNYSDCIGCTKETLSGWTGQYNSTLPYSPYYQDGVTAGNFGDVARGYETDAAASAGSSGGVQTPRVSSSNTGSIYKPSFVENGMEDSTYRPAPFENGMEDYQPTYKPAVADDGMEDYTRTSITTKEYNQMRADCGGNGVCLNDLTQKYGNSLTTPSPSVTDRLSSVLPAAPTAQPTTVTIGDGQVTQDAPCAWGGTYIGQGKYSCPIPTLTKQNTGGANPSAWCSSMIGRTSTWCW